MNKNKQLVINLLASFIAYAVTLGINFFLSPYIVKSVGVDAYGFIGLANNFVSYASLITIALNSLAGRFVTVRIYEHDIEGANKYFSSVFIANAILTGFMFVLSAIILFYLEYLISIPDNIFWDVKILFATLFLNCLVGVIGSVYNIAVFATNKLYLNSIRQIESNIIKVLLIILLFVFFAPRVCYMGIATLVTGIYVVLCNIYYTKKLTPYLKVKKKYYDIKSIRELLSSGVWNLVNRLGTMLQDGLDLLITNIFIDSISMGVLSLAKTIPTIINGIVGTIAGIFSPNFTILYAEKKYNELVTAIKQSSKIMGIIVNLPIIILIVCGDIFYSLWQPTQNAQTLHVLSILTCVGLIFNGGVNCIYNLFTVVNKLKVSSISVCVTGIISTCIVFILLKMTSLGLYAIAGTSSIVATLRNLIVIIPYGAKCLNLKWYAFFPDIIRPVVFVTLSCVIGCIIRYKISFEGWIGLFCLTAIILSISLFIGLFIILRKEDRKYLIRKIKKY